MTITLELRPELEARLKETAGRMGVSPEQYLEDCIDQIPKMAPEMAPLLGDDTLALLSQWDAEEAARTPEEVEQAEAMWEELQASLNANRVATGERLLFP